MTQRTIPLRNLTEKPFSTSPPPNPMLSALNVDVVGDGGGWWGMGWGCHQDLSRIIDFTS